jgi:hypothetical protein
MYACEVHACEVHACGVYACGCTPVDARLWVHACGCEVHAVKGTPLRGWG